MRRCLTGGRLAPAKEELGLGRGHCGRDDGSHEGRSQREPTEFEPFRLNAMEGRRERQPEANRAWTSIGALIIPAIHYLLARDHVPVVIEF